MSLQGILSMPTPRIVWVGTYLTPYLICYLIHIPHTRPLRIGLWPVGLLCMSWLICTIDLGEPLLTLPLTELALRWNLNAGIQPFFHAVRQTTPFKAWDLLFDTRNISQQPQRPQTSTTGQSYTRSVVYHLAMATFHSLMGDLTTFLPYYIIPPSHPILGVGKPLGRVFWPVCAGSTMYQGTAMIYELVAFLGVASGLYAPGEWVKMFNNPLKSSSLVELWGTRYHQLMRICFTTYAAPFASISRSFQILGVFLVSTLYHSLLYYPFHHDLLGIHVAQSKFWLGAGIGCILERAYYRTTGRYVEGWGGRVWMWGWLILCSQTLVQFEIEHGWMSRARGIARNGPGDDHLFNWILQGLGLPGPLEWNKGNAW